MYKEVKDAILLFSHGSLLCGSGEALFAHAERLRQKRIASVVEVGYLNYCTPTFENAAQKCLAAGATRIIVTPYFLVPGKFVRVDLPLAVADVRARFPNAEFIVGEAIGFDERLADALVASAHAAAPPECWRQDLQRAAIHCMANPECPLFGTPSCPRQPQPLQQETLA